MKLYHLTYNMKEDSVFFPRVPLNITDGEDETIKRVCFSSSLEGALTAIPFGGSEFSQAMIKLREGEFDRNELKGIDADLKLFVLDLDKPNLDYIVRDNYIIKPEELYKKELVPDAIVTDEHWIMTAFEIPDEDIHYIKINDWDESVSDVIPLEVFDSYLEGDDYEQKYREITGGELLPTCIKIIDIDYEVVTTQKELVEQDREIISKRKRSG